jgi:hypothetical protein
MMRLLVKLAVLLALIAAVADAQQKKPDGSKQGEGLVNKLLAPGPLMKGHQDLEHGDCLKCHDAGQGVPNERCLSCHTAIGKSIKEGDSFHSGNSSKPCISCHSDHKGRSYDSTVVNTSSFDHAKTGFTLKGAHAKVKCASCHTETRSGKATRKGETRFFGGRDESCIGCHKKEDPHRFPGKLAGKECSTCHSETSWKGATFDHQRETGYALVGNHAKQACSKCHTGWDTRSVKYTFPGLSTQKCLTCHKDHHKDGLSAKFKGGDCARCHDQQNWKIEQFNHSGVTGFPLKGEHGKIACASCHKQQPGIKFAGLSQSCVSCHKDYHGFGKETSAKFGALTQCQACHDEAGWRVALDFNHNADTSFKIDGKHVPLKCFECHKPKGGNARTYEWPQLETKTCETCHISPHKGNPSPAFKAKCSSCHVTDGWHVHGKSSSNFQHDTMTRFPLTGDHAKLKCTQCHNKGGKEVFKFPNPKGGFCDACHKTPHQGQFRDKLVKMPCKDCHNTSEFEQVSFNHDLARFLLTGEHKKIERQCVQCHKSTGKTLMNTKPPAVAHNFKLPHHEKSFCVGCHKNVHEGVFRFDATNCASCHNTTSWKKVAAFDHDKTRFKIRGAHVKIKEQCATCHVGGKFKFDFAKRGFCEACHTNVHKNQFSMKFSTRPCVECHTQQTFTRRLEFDHDKTSFKITGAHAEFAGSCSKCHVKSGKMLPTQPPKPAGKFRFANQKTGFCESCHHDEHEKQFHKKLADRPCRECHVTNQFHKKQKFDHDLARFLLKGKHVPLRCGQCHTRTKERYKQSPHRLKGLYIWDDLFSKDCATCHTDVHKGRFGKRCSECHSEDGWDETAEFHKNLMLGGVHNSLECGECHVDKRLLSGMGDDCKACHHEDDVHMGSQPDCASCHTQQVWDVTRFKHALTDFPLRGVHRTLECQACHAQGVYQGLPTDCLSCHFKDASQATFPNHSVGGFEQCDQCHNQFSFPGATAAP